MGASPSHLKNNIIFQLKSNYVPSSKLNKHFSSPLYTSPIPVLKNRHKYSFKILNNKLNCTRLHYNILLNLLLKPLMLNPAPNSPFNLIKRLINIPKPQKINLLVFP